MNKKKSQISIEFMFVIGVIFIIFLIISTFIFERKIELINTEKYLNKRNECFKFSNLINSVFTDGDGTKVTTRTNYLITVNNRGVITVKENLTESEEISCNFNAEILGLTNTIIGNITIENENNLIIFKNETI